MTKLPKITDKRIDEIENASMDDGRFFVHLKPGLDWCSDPHQVIRTRSFGSRKEVVEALKDVKPVL